MTLAPAAAVKNIKNAAEKSKTPQLYLLHIHPQVCPPRRMAFCEGGQNGNQKK
jgi:hypothetical protein